MKKNTTKFALLMGVSIASLSLIVMKGLNDYFFNSAIKRKMNPYVRQESEDDKSSVIDSARKWFSSMNASTVNLHAFDEVQLHVKLLQQDKSSKWVIIAHGYSANYKEELDVAQNFYEQGFNLMMVDLRGHGLSSGKYIGFGWPDRLDILTCINYLCARDKDIKIVLYGLSMGASTMMNVTGENLPEQVVCCIEDSGYSSMENIMRFMLKNRFSFIPEMMHGVIIHNINRSIKNRCRYSLFDNSCVKQLKKSKTPTMFIHGEDDEIVPFEMVFENYYACAASKELYTIPSSLHGLSNLKPQYYGRVFQFINRYIEN